MLAAVHVISFTDIFLDCSASARCLAYGTREGVRDGDEEGERGARTLQLLCLG